MSIKELQESICRSLCSSVQLHQKSKDIYYVETPFMFNDGDLYTIYLRKINDLGVRISDFGNTLMRISYENDIDKFREGIRGKILEQIISEFELGEDNGSFYLDTSFQNIGENLFKFTQAITKIYDLIYLNKYRAEQTFYEDLKKTIVKIVPEEKITENYTNPDFQQGKDYEVDFKIEAKNDPIYLFGVPNKDKARLVTITLERFLREKISFDSLIVFRDVGDIPRKDLSRLLNACGDTISSLDAEEDLMRKLSKKIAS